MSDVSVIIPNWNGAAMLRRTLVCLARQSEAPAEIIVVDNGSVDDSAAVIREAEARLISLPENRGFSAAVNEGIRSARGEWVAILNNDVETDPEWLGTLLRRAIAQDAWFATGKLISSDRPTHLDGAWDAICRGACAWRCGAQRQDGPQWNAERRIQFAPFTAALFRAELFRRVGPLDETFESYLEDVDFGMRCAIRGYSGVYVPAATARHKGSATLGRWHKDTVRRIARNQVLLVARHFPPQWVRRYGWPVLVGQALWGLLALRHGAGFAFLKGKWQGVREFGRVRADAAPLTHAIAEILCNSEKEIRDLQRQTGYDLYWRLYFALT